MNVLGRAAYCPMTSTTMALRVIQRQDRRTQHGIRMNPWPQMSGRRRFGHTTSHRRRQLRLDGLLSLNLT